MRIIHTTRGVFNQTDFIAFFFPCISLIMSLGLLKKSLVGLSGYFEEHEKNDSDKQIAAFSVKKSIILPAKSHLTQKYGRRSIQQKRALAAQQGHHKKVRKTHQIMPSSSSSSSSNSPPEPVTITILSK